MVPEGAVPAYLMDREGVSRAKVPKTVPLCTVQRNLQVLSNTVKQKRKEKAGKWSVPIAKVKPLVEDEVLKVVKSGKRKSNAIPLY